MLYHNCTNSIKCGTRSTFSDKLWSTEKVNRRFVSNVSDVKYNFEENSDLAQQDHIKGKITFLKRFSDVIA